MDVGNGCLLPSVSEPVALDYPKLTDLPNELLVLIVSYLDSHSILHLRTACQRLHALTSDPVNWSTISWEATNRIKDVDGLNLALKLSKGVLRHLSGCGWHFDPSLCIDQILGSNHLRSISLKGMALTEEQVIKVLSLPTLTYLYLDRVDGSLFKTTTLHGRQLETLHFSSIEKFSLLNYISIWSNAGYSPQDLRITANYNATDHDYRSLPPSVNQRACLSIYRIVQPDLQQFIIGVDDCCHQVWFTPKPTVYVTNTPCGNTLSLAANPPGSKNFSAARCYYKSTGVHVKDVDFYEVCNMLTHLQLGYYYKDLHVVPVGPNLIHLELGVVQYWSQSEGLFMDLSGLRRLTTVSSNCPKLKVLRLKQVSHVPIVHCTDPVFKVQCTEIWNILARMVNLKVLSIPVFMIPDTNIGPIPMPSLTDISIITSIDIFAYGINGEYIERALDFLSSMPSLKVFNIAKESLNVDFSEFLHACPNLTHLGIYGSGVTLPTDPSCYANLEQMVLDGGRFYDDEEDGRDDNVFFLDSDVAEAIAQSEKLRVLLLRAECDGEAIPVLVNWAKSLKVFHIDTNSETITSTLRDNIIFRYNSDMMYSKFVEHLTEGVKRKGRIIDFKISTSSSQQ